MQKDMYKMVCFDFMATDNGERIVLAAIDRSCRLEQKASS